MAATVLAQAGPVEPGASAWRAWRRHGQLVRAGAMLLGCCLVLAGGLAAQQDVRPSPTADTFGWDAHIYVGVDYYPEQWPRERWETDVRLMQEAGFNVVRLAEFSWVLLEPTEGVLESGWLDEVLALLDRYGVFKEDAFYDRLIARLLEDAGIERWVDLPAGVEASVRQGGGRTLMFLINHNETERSVAIPPGKRDVLADKVLGDRVTLGPLGVAVIAW